MSASALVDAGPRLLLLRVLATDAGGRVGLKVVTTKSKEGPTLGVAILAGVGAGLYPSVREACDSMIEIDGEQMPIKENQPAYAKCYAQYKALYPDMRAAFKRLSQ